MEAAMLFFGAVPSPLASLAILVDQQLYFLVIFSVSKFRVVAHSFCSIPAVEHLNYAAGCPKDLFLAVD